MITTNRTNNSIKNSGSSSSISSGNSNEIGKPILLRWNKFSAFLISLFEDRLLSGIDEPAKTFLRNGLSIVY